jgi:hypothetical protein
MKEKFIEKANSIHNNFYDYSLVEYKNNKTKVKIICPKHGVFEQQPINHTNGQGCRKCGFEKSSASCRKSKDNLIQDFQKIHGEIFDYSLVEYKNNNQNIKIICKIHGEFEQTPHNHINGHGCPKCAIEYKGKKLSRSTEEFINKSSIKHNNFFTYKNSIYINNKTKIIVTCPTHGDFKTNPSHHLNGIGCSKCSGTYVRSNEEFISDCKKIHGKKYDYSLTLFKNLKSKVLIICNKHGEFLQNANHHLSGCGCPKCNSSKGENEIRLYLEKHNFKIKEQKRFNDCRNKKPLPFDFFLLEKNICIEYDGIHHFKPIRGQKQLEITKNNDNIKNLYCKNNNIKLIRIKYTETNIENILKTIKN